MTRLLALRNRQRVRPVNLRLLRRVAAWAIAELGSAHSHELCIHLVTAREMAGVNQAFLNHSGSTDVITFDHSTMQLSSCHPQRPARPRTAVPKNRSVQPAVLPPLHGEIYISLADAVSQARTFAVTWQSELVRYLLHALLHLRGFEDRSAAARRRMKREENRLLRLAARQFRFRDLARRKP